MILSLWYGNLDKDTFSIKQVTEIKIAYYIMKKSAIEHMYLVAKKLSSGFPTKWDSNQSPQLRD